jgi:heptosyltransferase-2
MTPSLVVQTSFLGDMVLTTPLIAELAVRGPVDVVATPANAGLLANNPAVRRIVVFDKRGTERGVAGLKRVASALNLRRRVDERETGTRAVAYLAQGSLRSATLVVLAGFRERVGFETSAGRTLYTRRVPYAANHHHAERLWSLAAPGSARATTEQLRPRLYPGDSEREAVDRLLRDAGVAGEPLMAMAPGSVWATKRWPYFAELARTMSERTRIVVIGAEADSPLAREIADAAGRSVIDATGRLSLLASAELIGRTTALVTNDSAPQHLASAMGVPTITLFGPTVPAFGFGPLAARSESLGIALECRPCHAHGPPVCPLGHWRCMQELGVEVVRDAVRRSER